MSGTVPSSQITLVWNNHIRLPENDISEKYEQVVMSELYSRAFSMVDNLECNKCGRQPGRGQPHLRSSNDEDFVFEANYKCECGIEYSIEIEGVEQGLRAEIERLDTGDVRTIRTADSMLHRKSHPAKEQIEALYDLQDALDMLGVNWVRVNHISENPPNYPGDIPLWNDRRFGAQVFTEIHNYLAAAYTFQETFHTAIQKLPSGEIIDSKFQEFKQSARIVIGLRTYVQHEQMFAVKIFPDLDADEYRTDFRVELDEVWTLESQVTEDNPQGYDDPPERIYENVDGEFIDILSQFEAHLEASHELVKFVDQFAHEEMGDELKEFMRLSNLRPDDGK